jgi:uncharacterized protein (DUF302 family)
MTSYLDSGLTHIASSYSFEETFQRVENKVRQAGLTVFAKVDHAAEAEKVGLQMRPTRVLIFGNPKGGTPVMVAAPTVAIDLPLKALVWQDSEGKIWVTYNSGEFYRQRHGIPENLVPNLSGAGPLIQSALTQ